MIRTILLIAVLLFPASVLSAVTVVDCPGATALKKKSASWGEASWCEFSDGRKHGPFLQLRSDGSADASGRYREDLRVGAWRSYHPNGEVSTETTYVAGEISGSTSSFFSDGAIRSTGRYIKGKPDGDFVEYFPDGQRKTAGSWSNGKRHGSYQTWFANGQTSQHGSFIDGMEDGPWTSWWDNGAKESEGNAVSGVRTGPWSFWNRKGRIRAQGTFTGQSFQSSRSGLVATGPPPAASGIMRPERE